MLTRKSGRSCSGHSVSHNHVTFSDGQSQFLLASPVSLSFSEGLSNCQANVEKLGLDSHVTTACKSHGRILNCPDVFFFTFLSLISETTESFDDF